MQPSHPAIHTRTTRHRGSRCRRRLHRHHLPQQPMSYAFCFPSSSASISWPAGRGQSTRFFDKACYRRVCSMYCPLYQTHTALFSVAMKMLATVAAAVVPFLTVQCDESILIGRHEPMSIAPFRRNPSSCLALVLGAQISTARAGAKP